MTSLLRKSIKVSLASILAIKAGDTFRKYDNIPLQPFFFRNVKCEALGEFNKDDLMGNIMKTEFERDLKDVAYHHKARYAFVLKSREEHLKEMMDEKNEYDLLIIGGGASGAGVALEAASRGLKCAVVDKYDFASGTSSRSTKMAHGGIRYFEKMMKLDGDPFENFELLKETLHERNYFLYAASFQNKPLQLVIPSSSWFWSVFFYYPGALLYHLMYLRQLMKSNYDTGLQGPRIYGRQKVKNIFSELKAIHGQYGTVIYETQMMDSRMNLNALLTASIDKYIPGMKGANLANYTEFVDFIKNENGQITGAILNDTLKQKQFKVKCKVLVNCAGIYADELRIKDNKEAKQRITGARGTHLMFSQGLLPENSGIIIPKTKDGRLIFIINYLGHAMVGTTDDKCEITHTPKPIEQDIEFIVSELKQIFGDNFDYKKNMISAWSGIRPLVVETEEDKQQQILKEQELNTGMFSSVKSIFKRQIIRLGHLIHGAPKGSTAALSRNHVIEKSASGMVSLMGGKWTSFRKMGEETVDLIINSNRQRLDVAYEKSVTTKFKLAGSYTALQVSEGIIQSDQQIKEQYEDHLVFEYGIDRKFAQHLFHSYGTAALRVARLGKENQMNVRIHENYPFLKSEILYAIRSEMAQKPNDILCRRVPIGFLNEQICREILTEVVEIMAKEKKWTNDQKKQELDEAANNLQYMM
ncbi:glycerol-3-phosphate dehydrogenase [Stylonychia lemnae]|uniref:glycerol-3-phosphate dehydrogenase n=1 Tax=Stylonychia lemnae TaxID=5949 RepID=A0A078ANE8_STYLE|nr:glycerol-3-phosphate dehydrogenase [Stylonychia lemnae]|eukprot:CDW82478.1 glycerol-3-phosphate dehydrogenase [Stylonychia lemnae]